MSENSSIYLDDPDPLSVLLTRLELKAEVYVNGNFCGTWAVDTAGSRRIPFHLIGDGEAWLHFQGDGPRQLLKKDMVLFPRDDHHIISSTRDIPRPDQVNTPMSNDGEVTQMVCGFFEFGNPAIFPVLDALSDVVFLSGQKSTERERMDTLVNLVLIELKDCLPGNYAAIDQIAFLMFIEILRQQMAMGELSRGLLSALFDARIGRALNAIHSKPEFAWSLGSLADEAAMSRSSFADKFSSLVGITPMKYLTFWRMTEARRLLSTTTMSTAQVAERSGYESDASFRKAFKNALGQTPGDVRSKSRALGD